jgi:hypothetical protein
MAEHGKGGTVKISTTPVLDITEWSMDGNADTKETTSFGGSGLPARTYVRGLFGSSGKITGNLNMGDTTGQLAIWNSLTSDTPLAGSFYVDSTHSFAGNFFVTKFSPKVNVDDLESVEFDFTFTGAVTFS